MTALFIPNRKVRTEKIPPFLDGCSGNAHGDRSRGPLFVLAFAKGAGIMLGYDILRAFRRGFPHGGRLVAAEDFFYWVFAWIFVFLRFRDRNYGRSGVCAGGTDSGDAFIYFAAQSEDPSRIFDFFRLSFRMIAGLFRLILMPAGKSVKKLRKMVRKALKKKIKQVRMVIVKSKSESREG